MSIIKFAEEPILKYRNQRSPIFGAIEDQQRAFRAHNALQGMLCAVLIGKSEREDKPI